MVNVGIIGLGFMGLTHLRAYKDTKGARLVAVADQVKKRLEGDLSGVQGNIAGPGEKYDFSGVETYEEAEALLDDPKVELVSICLPTAAHRPIVEAALSKGKHVLCEKPMALTAEDVDAMVELAQKSDRKLMVAQCIRFWPDYARAREIVRGGDLGRVLSARLERRSPLPTWGGWLAREELSGGMIVDLSLHDIDYAQYLLGVPESVRATGACDIEAGYDHYQGEMRYEDVSVYIEGGWLFPGEYPFSMSFDILCEKGILSYHTAVDRRLTVFHADGRTEKPGLAEGDGYSQEIAYLIDCIENDRQPEVCPANESALSVKLALLLKHSRDHDGLIAEVPEFWRE